jgi:serine protease Do
MFVGAVFVGVIAGLIIASNLDWTNHGLAKEDEARVVELGSSEPALNTGFDLTQLEEGFVKVSEEVMPSVVTITSAKIIKYRRNNPFSEFFNDDFFRRFWQVPDHRQFDNEEQEYRQQGLGSGVIVSSDGYIITNNHVVKDADEIQVVTYDKKEYSAEIIGRDEKTDVAVIKIDEKNLTAARLGDSSKMRVGQWVLAIGNPFSDKLGQTVTHGIVSATGRSNFRLAAYEDFIQTDAAINPGNSGGALVNLRGELIGINTAIISGGGGNVGIGFAIPINMARHVMEELIDKGHVVRGWLGVQIQDLDSDMAQGFGLDRARGALVSEVIAGSPAEKAGIEAGDIVLEIDGKEIEDYTRLSILVAAYEPGTTVELQVFRDQKMKNIQVTLEERPDDEQLAASESPDASNTSEKVGLVVEDLDSQRAQQLGYEGEKGVLVVSVKSGSVAYREGFRKNDLIKSINRKTVRNVNDFEKIMDSIKAGDIVFMRVLKDTDHYFISFKMPKE